VEGAEGEVETGSGSREDGAERLGGADSAAVAHQTRRQRAHHLRTDARQHPAATAGPGGGLLRPGSVGAMYGDL